MNISFLKLLGDFEFTINNILRALAVIILIGASGNAAYELLKMLPTLRLGGSPDWKGILSQLPPLFLGPAVVLIYYGRWRRLTGKRLTDIAPSPEVKRHRAVVLALSVPEKYDPPEKINVDISSKNLDYLYGIRSIGQLFKGIHHHFGVLEYVLPLRTEESNIYLECLDKFIERYGPPRQRITVEKNPLYLLKAKNDMDLIDEIKDKMAKIYSKNNLTNLRMEKKDIIVDLSGGLKTMSIGMVLGALDTEIDFQYIEQRSKSYKLTPLNISPATLYDKIGEHLLDLYNLSRQKI